MFSNPSAHRHLSGRLCQADGRKASQVSLQRQSCVQIQRQRQVAAVVGLGAGDGKACVSLLNVVAPDGRSVGTLRKDHWRLVGRQIGRESRLHSGQLCEICGTRWLSAGVADDTLTVRQAKVVPCENCQKNKAKAVVKLRDGTSHHYCRTYFFFWKRMPLV